MDKILLLIDRGLNAFLYSNGEVEMVSLAELNDLIGKQQITVKNINNNLIASLYNKSDYGAEKTLNNILMNKNNISINTISIIDRMIKPYISRIFIKNDFLTLVGGAGTFYI